MIKAIINNPYRILGVYSNSPKKEQIANKGKMQAFLRVKKSMPFPLDLKGILPEIKRTQDEVDYADSELALSSGQIKHAQFWFVNKTQIDGVAFNHLLAGNIDSAMEIWSKSKNMSSLQNLFVCYLIKGDYTNAITDCAIPFYNNFAKTFVSLIDEKYTISASELISSIVDTLAEEGLNTIAIANCISDSIWKGQIETKRVNPLLSQLESHISEAKSTKGKGCNARLNAGNKLKIVSKPLLNSLKSIMSSNDTRYQMIADKTSQEVLQCSIDYYNDSDDFDAPAKALPLCEYAKTIAIGNAAQQRCNENYAVLKRAFDNTPPIEVTSEVKEIEELLMWYQTQKRTSAIGLNLLKKARLPLISIKEKLGKDNEFYLEISSKLGSAALSNVIDDVNKAQKEDKPNPLRGLFGNSKYRLYDDILGEPERRRQKAYTLKTVLAIAWRTILYIDLLETTEDFKNNRYLPNRKALHSIIDGYKGFECPNDNYIIMGCAHGIYAEEKFFWSDSEYFSSCKSISDFRTYLQRFPSGNHMVEANRRIKEITAHDMKITGFILIIAIILGIVLLIFFSSAKVQSNIQTDDNPTTTKEIYPRHIDESESDFYEVESYDKSTYTEESYSDESEDEEYLDSDDDYNSSDDETEDYSYDY